MPKYSVKSPIRFGGKKHTEGFVEMDHKMAQPLIKIGVLGKAAPTSTNSHNATLTDVEMTQLVDAIGKLENGNKDHWTKSGKPEIKALEQATGININAKQRDEAFAVFNA